jgi:ABC-type antimicrobial peptide transport system ATPase subunit
VAQLKGIDESDKASNTKEDLLQHTEQVLHKFCGTLLVSFCVMSTAWIIQTHLIAISHPARRVAWATALPDDSNSLPIQNRPYQGKTVAIPSHKEFDAVTDAGVRDAC